MIVVWLLLLVAQLSLALLIHGIGRFLAARALGMRVDRFSLGFGPSLLSWTYNDILYQVAVVPFGAFVRIAGQNAADDTTAANDPRAHFNRPLWARLLVILAGPAACYLFAALLLAGAALIWGTGTPDRSPSVGAVMEGSPARFAGLEAGDRVLAVDDRAVATMNELVASIDAAGGQPVTIQVQRAGQFKTFAVTPRLDEPQHKWRIGVQLTPSIHWERPSVSRAIRLGFWQANETLAQTLNAYAAAVRPRPQIEFSGPVGIIRMLKTTRTEGPPLELLTLVSLLMATLIDGFFPLPPLTGGRLVLLGYAALLRRRPTARTEKRFFFFGILLAVATLLTTLARDLLRALH